jgi:hypothetical protein
MNRSMTSVPRITLLAVLLTFAFATTASAATAIHFQPEGLPVLKAQLHHHEVHALTFHPAPAPGHIHVSMSGGRHFTVTYLAAEQPQLVALARANGARYAITVAKPKATAKAHHTLRYIAGGIVIVVILVVAAVLLVDRRRKLNEGASAASAPGDSAI